MERAESCTGLCEEKGCERKKAKGARREEERWDKGKLRA